VNYFFSSSLVLATILASCSTNNEEEIRVGFIGPLTGDVASVGIDNLRGIEVAVDDINKAGGINGKKVKLIVEDDAFDEKQTIKTYQKLTSIDNVDVILSPTYGGLLSIVSQADESKNVIVNSLDTSEELAEAGEYLFAIGIHDENIGYAVANYAADDLQETEVAVIYNQDSLMVLISDAFKIKFEEKGGKVVIDEGYDPSTQDFRTVLLKVKESGVKNVAFFGFDESGLIPKQAKQLGLDVTLLTMDTATSENFLANAGSASEGIYFSSWDASHKSYKDFEVKFVNKYSVPPQQPLFSAAGYDATMLVTNAMRKGQRGEALHDELYKIKDVQGITGTLTMSPDGIVRTVDEEMFQIRNNEFIKL